MLELSYLYYEHFELITYSNSYIFDFVRSGVWGLPGGRGGAMGWGMSGGRGGQGGRSGAVYIKHKTIIKTEKGKIF